MESNYNIILTNQFNVDFEEISDYFIEHFKNKDLIKNLNNQIIFRKNLLTRFPRSFPIFESNCLFRHEYRSFI